VTHLAVPQRGHRPSRHQSKLCGSGQLPIARVQWLVATRTLNFREWLKLVARHGLDDGFKNLAGYPVDDVAARLSVHRSRVYQLIEEESLDRIQVLTKTGKVAITLITQASLERYLAERVPDRNRQGYFAFQE
jgi:hypothetical protein